MLRVQTALHLFTGVGVASTSPAAFLHPPTPTNSGAQLFCWEPEPISTQETSNPSQEVLGADPSTYPGAGARLGPVNRPAGEVPMVETHQRPPHPVKLPPEFLLWDRPRLHLLLGPTFK